MTGALSPVMADSSTLAMPSMTSPSPGMVSPASTTHDVAAAQLRGGDRLGASAAQHAARGGFGLGLAQSVGLRFAAALGHGFGEVGEEHGEPEPERDLEGEAGDAAPLARSRTARSVVMTAPTSTTNITGFFIMVRGLSLTNESVMARLTMGGSKSGRERERFLAGSTNRRQYVRLRPVSRVDDGMAYRRIH